ncbi:MAG: deoxyuridine 5'-triphosphate nucleotidohydrolase [Nitrososphaeria archaeon]
MSILSGEEVAKYVEGVVRDQIQPNGVDLTFDKVYRIIGAGKIMKDEVTLPDYVETFSDANGIYHLDKGVYILQIRERISVPLDAVGLCLPRSSLVRIGADIGAALWDSGYVGYSKILLKVDNPILLERGSRIAQFMLVRSIGKTEVGYRGRYQNEWPMQDQGRP